MKQKFIKQAHQESWERFIAAMEHDLYCRQTMPYKVMKTFRDRETFRVNMAEGTICANHYRKLCFESEIENGKCSSAFI